MARGIIIAALGTNAGKTLIAAALMRLLTRRGQSVQGFKVGPDYIDPGFHSVACGRDCANLDLWAMRPDTWPHILSTFSSDRVYTIIEGVMGLFDGAADGTGSTADLSAATGLPIILIADAQGQGPSLAAAIKGFLDFRDQLDFRGIILNSVAGDRHERMLRAACNDFEVPILGCLPRVPELTLATRHLGLVQASETEALGEVLDRAAEWIQVHIAVDTLLQTAAEIESGPLTRSIALPLLGQRIAVAKDIAFSFSYPHVLEGWRSAGAEIYSFSPLADEAPQRDADAVYLPGGYPELYAGRLAAATNFKNGIRQAANTGALVFGECGGYMTMGEGLIDGAGARHEMIGLLPLTTSFARPKLHLGYRKLQALEPEGLFGINEFRGHEFHYASVVEQGDGDALFRAFDGFGDPLGENGCRRGRVMGSFMHLIDAV